MSSTSTFPENLTSAASDAANDAYKGASNAATQATNKAGELGRDAVDKMDASRGAVAQGIHSTADAIRSYAPAAVSSQADSTATALESAADYVRSRDLRSMTADLTEVVRRNPGPAMMAAVAIGFLLGTGLRRRS